MAGITELRLILIGDDEALDVLAELARHLPVYELQRTDDLPTRALDSEDVVVIGAGDARVRDALLRRVLSAGAPRHVAVTPNRHDAGARAILVAAELVRALLPEGEA